MKYRETISEKVEGVGFYSPSSHFSEIHLLLEPGSTDSGIKFVNKIPHGVLDSKWQKQIMMTLKTTKFHGVLINAPLTDVKISLIGGSQQTKYSHASDFRNATLRAVRQGLMKLRAKNAVKILSAVCGNEIEVGEEVYGKVAAIIGQNSGEIIDANSDLNSKIKIKMSIPEENLEYFKEKIRPLIKNKFKLKTLSKRFVVSQNQKSITNKIAYNPEKDLGNPANAVSCPHSSDDLIVPWNKYEEIVFYPMSKI